MIEIINLIYSFSEICNINLKYKIMKKSLLLILSLVLFVACGKKENTDTDFPNHLIKMPQLQVQMRLPMIQIEEKVNLIKLI